MIIRSLFLVILFLFPALTGIAKPDGPAIQWYYNLPPDDFPNPFSDDLHGGFGARAGLIDQLNLAESSIEGSFYQINDPFIVDALVRAADRGVDVTVTTDTDWLEKEEYEDAYTKLEAGGVEVIDDNRRALNHNKYCIIDRDEPRARVWMGSTNITKQGSNENGNASFLFIDPLVAKIFGADFDQMAEGYFQTYKGGIFMVGDELHVIGQAEEAENDEESEGDEGEEEGLKYKKLSHKHFSEFDEEISYPHVKIGESEVEFYFLPRHNMQRRVVEEIYAAKESIHFGTYTLDNPMIIQAIINKADSPQIDSPYNVYPVALRQHPWENLKRTLRSAEADGITFEEGEIKKDEWKKWKEDEPDLFGAENKGLFYSAAKIFYPSGEAGGEIQKVQVYGMFNWLGLSKGPYAELLELGLNVRKTAFRGALHHKFIIIDRKVLILGSYNFSTTAERRNDESAVIIRDPEIVEGFYQTVFKPTYMNAYPEYLPGDEELDEFSYERQPVVFTEIHFNPKGRIRNRFVEIHNYTDCETEEECDAWTVDLTGWKFWNGLIPKHENILNIRGSVDSLVSYWNDPYTNKYGLNHPTKGYFLKPELETLRPGEYALIVGRDFELKSLHEYLDDFATYFEQIYGRAPEEIYEKFPKLFVSGSPRDADLGGGLKPFQFLTLFYPDQFTMADRFDLNLEFQDKESGIEDFDALINSLSRGDMSFEIDLEDGQSLERVLIDVDAYKGSFDTYVESYGGDNRLIWYGLQTYSEKKYWKPNVKKVASPGYGYVE